MLKLKDSSVVVAGLKSEMYFALGIADRAFADEGLECVLTSGLDGNHGNGSLHMLGRAIDLRNTQCSSAQKARVYERLRRLERYGFDVINEGEGATENTTAPHFHIEFDPKSGETFWRIS